MAWSSTAGTDRWLAVGSEGGPVILDEEHEDGARITLEGSGASFAITCGIYGWMVHTRFFDNEHEATSAVDEMKPGIAAILAMIPMRSDPLVDEKIEAVSRRISDFVDRFPS